MKTFLISKILLVIFLLFAAQRVYAGIGISPASIDNARLKPGSSFSEEFVLSTNLADSDLSVSIESDIGAANSWLSFEPGANFIIKKGVQRESFKITVTPPSNADLRDYKGYIRIKVSPVNNSGGGIAVVQGARIDVNLTTSTEDYAELLVRAIRLDGTDTNSPLKLTLKIENKGNVAGSPNAVDIEVLDLDQKKIKTLLTNNIKKVDPNRTEEVTNLLEHGLPPGEYFGLVKVYFQNKLIREEKVVFKITAGSFVSAPIEASGSATTMLFVGGVILTAILAAAAVLLKRRRTNTTKPPRIETTNAEKPAKKAVKHKKRSKRKSKLAAAAVLGAVATLPIILSLRQPLPKQQIQGELAVQKQTEAKYNIYTDANFSSLIIYRAQEGEKFDVIKTTGEWYQVRLPNGQLGWVHLSSIKEAGN